MAADHACCLPALMIGIRHVAHLHPSRHAGMQTHRPQQARLLVKCFGRRRAGRGRDVRHQAGHRIRTDKQPLGGFGCDPDVYCWDDDVFSRHARSSPGSACASALLVPPSWEYALRCGRPPCARRRGEKRPNRQNLGPDAAVAGDER